MIFKIFKKDLKGLSRNILALAIANGLCLKTCVKRWNKAQTKRNG